MPAQDNHVFLIGNRLGYDANHDLFATQCAVRLAVMVAVVARAESLRYFFAAGLIERRSRKSIVKLYACCADPDCKTYQSMLLTLKVWLPNLTPLREGARTYFDVNDKHLRGRKYKPSELERLRDEWFRLAASGQIGGKGAASLKDDDLLGRFTSS